MATGRPAHLSGLKLVGLLGPACPAQRSSYFMVCPMFRNSLRPCPQRRTGSQHCQLGSICMHRSGSPCTTSMQAH